MPIVKKTENIRTRNPIDYFIYALIALVFIRGILFIAIIPAGEIPDEHIYLQNIKSISEGKIPYFIDKSASGHPVLYELMMTPIYLTTKSLGNDNFAYMLLRIMSTLFLVLTVYISYLTTKLISEKNKVIQILCPSIIALSPQIGFISSGLSPESLLNLIFCFFLFLIIKFSTTKIDIKNTSILIIAITIGLLVKERFLIFLPILIFALIIKFSLFLKENPVNTKEFINKNLISFANIHKMIAFLIATIASVLVIFAFSKTIIAYFKHAFIESPHQALSLNVFLFKIFKQFWGYFGWLQVPLPKTTYILIAIFCLPSIAGLILYLRQVLMKKIDRNQLISLSIFATTFILALLAVFGYEWRTGTSQGRYLFIAILPISYFLALGFDQIIIPKYKLNFITLIFLSLLSLNIYSMIWIIYPFYF